MKILVINPGSTSTKMAEYKDEKPILLRHIAHTAEELAPFGDITEQLSFRRQLVLDELQQANIPLDFDAVIGRGGLVKPIAGGVYEINQKMIDDTLHGCVMHNHACNLGCLIAHEIAATIPGCRRSNSSSRTPSPIPAERDTSPRRISPRRHLLLDWAHGRRRGGNLPL